MQDVLGIMHAIPEKAKERIKTLMGLNLSDGSTKTVLYPSNGEMAGGSRSDHHLWTAYSVCTYIRESGDYGFLDEMVPYADGGEGTVLEHMPRGLEYTKSHVGKHGIPNFLISDWNDSLANIGADAESAFVFFQAAHAAMS